MNNRSTWLTVLGMVLSVAWRTGDCGRTTLHGVTGAEGRYIVRITENPQIPFDKEFGISVACRVCHWRTEECTWHRGARTATGGTYAKPWGGTYVSWGIPPGSPPGRAPVTLTATLDCTNSTDDYYNRPGGVGISWGGFEKLAGNPSITAVGRGGVWASTPNWRDYSYTTGLDLKIRPDGSSPGDTAAPLVVSLSYPEELVLDRRGTEGKVIYDVEGNAGLLVTMGGLPNGLACVRRSDRVRIDSGAAVAVGPGDAISCTNEMGKPGRTAGIITVTAMIK